MEANISAATAVLFSWWMELTRQASLPISSCAAKTSDTPLRQWFLQTKELPRFYSGEQF